MRARWSTDDPAARLIGASLLAVFFVAIVWTFATPSGQRQSAMPSTLGGRARVPSTSTTLSPELRAREIALEHARNVQDMVVRAIRAVRTGPDTRLGAVLVDSRGMTLYTLRDAAGGEVECVGDCTSRWTPLVVPDMQGPEVVAVASDVSVRFEAGGRALITYEGAVLYLFEGDHEPGDTNGEEVTEGSGLGHAVRVG